VLEMQPGYLAARDYLQQIDAGESPGPRPALAAIDTPTFAPETGTGTSFQDQDTGDLKEEILVPPEPGEGGGRSGSRPAVAPGGPRRAAVAREMSPLQKFLLVGSLVLAVVAAGVYYLYQNKDKFWPNSRDEEAIPVEDPIRRATDLHKAGKTKIAISQLRRLPPVDPHYQEAQALITQWEAAVAPAAPAGSTEPGLDPELAARRQALLEQARQALAQRSHYRAKQSFEQAKAIEPLADEDVALLAQAQAALEPIAAEIGLFEQHDWEFALKPLWAKHEKEPANADVTRLLIDSYYNLGVRDLQKSDPARAAQNFQEALNLDPKDSAMQRQKRFADTYRERPQDLLFRIYVKYLPYR
jgi:tetratricopeptide (TPR) repeat protein